MQLPTQVKNSANVQSFKVNLKHHFIDCNLGFPTVFLISFLTYHLFPGCVVLCYSYSFQYDVLSEFEEFLSVCWCVLGVGVFTCLECLGVYVCACVEGEVRAMCMVAC